jgi:uncharacterized damage-inducible protein DinB
MDHTRNAVQEKTHPSQKEKNVQVLIDVTRPIRTFLPAVLICLLAPAAAAFAQGTTPAPAPPPPAFTLPKENAVSAWHKYMYSRVQTILLRSAEKMPEENYGFKPTDAVRSYGQILGHVADAQYTFCSIALGEKNPAPKIEQNKTSKADLTAALKEAFAYCDKAYGGMTDASSGQPVKLFGSDAPRLGVLIVNTAHTMEHYGNLVTYMRLKNIVPPSSEAGSMAPPKQ